MNLARIEDSLKRLFTDEDARWARGARRIVFWYDAEAQFTEAFATLELPDVQKVVLDHAPFNLKYRLQVLEPDASFLIYAPFAQPPTLDNWLLDVELYSASFSADRAALLYRDLKLTRRALEGFIRARLDFFRKPARESALNEIGLPLEATERDLRGAMLCVLTGVRALDVGAALRRLFAGGLEESQNALWAEVTASLRIEDVWAVVADHTGYSSAAPRLRQAMICLLLTHFERGFHGSFPLAWQSLLVVPGGHGANFIESWFRDSLDAPGLCALSAELQDDLEIAGHLTALGNVAAFRDAHSFEACDHAIIRAGVADALRDDADSGAWPAWLAARRTTPWHTKNAAWYRALEAAFALQDGLRAFERSQGAAAGALWSAYTESLYRIDRAYREFITASDDATGEVLRFLTDHLERRYVFDFLEPLAALWDAALSSAQPAPTWGVAGVRAQTEFFARDVQPMLARGERERVFVIVSDALRFEVASELRDLVQRDLRGEVGLEAQLSTLPSVTKFGMAALLPAPNGAVLTLDGSDVLRGGLDTTGTPARAAVLEAFSGVSATALLADDVLVASNEAGRDLVKPYRLVYIYHNRIDATGDKLISERNVFAAARETVLELTRLIKKIVNSLNGNNIVVTSDHGFLYQRLELERLDTLTQPKDDLLHDRGLRHALGPHLEGASGTQVFTPNWAADPALRVVVPTGTLRFKASGGKNYVHGGSSLQEVCVPVLTYRHVRAVKGDDGPVRKVGVQIGNAQRRITNNRFNITLVQSETIGGRLRARQITVRLETLDGEAISDAVRADLSSSAVNPAERSQVVRLTVLRPLPANTAAALVVRDSEDGTELLRDTWTVNIALSDDFADF